MPENFTLAVCALRLAAGNPARPCRKLVNAFDSFYAFTVAQFVDPVPVRLRHLHESDSAAHP